VFEENISLHQTEILVPCQFELCIRYLLCMMVLF